MMKKNKRKWNERLKEAAAEIVFSLLFFVIGFGVYSLFWGSEKAWEAEGDLLILLGVLLLVLLGVTFGFLLRLPSFMRKHRRLQGKDGICLVPMKKEDFGRFYTALCEAFVREERRAEAEARLVLSHKDYVVYRIVEEEKHLGYITLWYFPRFVFIEHFFILEAYRGQGCGGRVLSLMQKHFHGMVLEAEPSNMSDIAARRVAFYEKWGFYVNPQDYLQPSYHGEEPVPLVIMSHGAPLGDFDCTVAALYKKVYSIRKKKG